MLALFQANQIHFKNPPASEDPPKNDQKVSSVRQKLLQQ